MFRAKLIAALTATTALGVSAASAADFAARPYTKAPAYIDTIYNWAGFYIGGNVGGSWTNQEWINSANNTAFGDLSPGQGFRQSGAGVFGGGQIGYNWQANNFVFGLEGTVAGLDNSGTVVNNVFGAGRDDRFNWRTDWMVTVVARAGFAVQNNLFYVRGGYAGANNSLSVADIAPPATGNGTASAWHNGWTVGAGWEYGITPNWIIGLEYDYASFEKKNYQLAGAAAPATYAFDVRPHDIQSAVFRLSYKFGPVLGPRY
ncbi:outer membrane protein [Bradyrhizobium lablabi]|uniref:outer membrane protein n=1 Tax=Bradyrhizobium lablabi TaxID=722472 RepID=UPI001BA7DC77|nr:outer membrane beta-barrel protein [Bradyrhizobium lablabi]MBR0693008.1 porin family protein [Bradyrhizobium lablabi]